MKDRELIARNIINIIDITNCHNWIMFMNDDMYKQIYDYMMVISKGNKAANKYIEEIMLNNKEVIDKIVQDVDISTLEFNTLMESFREYKREFMLK
ncbi:hypothetical protein CWE04_12020 [Thomasclavelia cocleata]|uniref:Uncharacterized protein n=1 Tax=Thomasclavelia cocleata TaxID=69824 RepID=A0A1I0BMS7_9FIRM|nr:hypothetical protein [Thomasclavelia cocleata]MCR1960174.1 hypothetical protein [Thomasclavelia cocleata]NDO41852.1 hypothetical protein [Thomasclavelia cocleata]PJN79929.1 hypothetical protein CWE04_12020 [Thomasclavelia cocleata]SET08333.1 hypothetical protein SAMN04489758_101193 [Thomasclavelia cocleata]